MHCRARTLSHLGIRWKDFLSLKVRVPLTRSPPVLLDRLCSIQLPDVAYGINLSGYRKVRELFSYLSQLRVICPAAVVISDLRAAPQVGLHRKWVLDVALRKCAQALGSKRLEASFD